MGIYGEVPWNHLLKWIFTMLRFWVCWNHSFFSNGIYRSCNSLHVWYNHDFNDHDWLHETLVLNVFLFANREHIYIYIIQARPFKNYINWISTECGTPCKSIVNTDHSCQEAPFFLHQTKNHYLLSINSRQIYISKLTKVRRLKKTLL